MGLLKDLYSEQFYNSLSAAVSAVLPSFGRAEFKRQIYTPDFESKELKERMKHTTRVLHGFLPAGYPEAVKAILNIVRQLQKTGIGEDGLAYMFIPDYIETYGLDDFDTSINALETITQFVSCEFAVRPFLLKYGQQMIDQMQAWSLHPNYKVRRFASEGSRPRLPWAMAIPALKKDPAPILPLLENLKNDPSEWVRRSVANNINDIAKDHPAIVINLATRWKGFSKETDAIIKHGCRTLLKQGHTEILSHYGLKSESIHLSAFEVLTPKVKIGDSLEFSFTVVNDNPESHTVRLEYGIYYKKANGQLNRKVFKISEKSYEPYAKVNILRKQSFRLITTRVFYTGGHQLSIIINGEEKEVKDFEVVA
ncbi:DNA alkylation repair protein [Mucilaginibacter gynuensis]|uniref:DNA alkylation repair protein n=1 Tax=Mucilaginibacter gynuensis TaxID=1302236 RepID=A0ABP8HKZ9_9SPHI